MKKMIVQSTMISLLVIAVGIGLFCYGLATTIKLKDYVKIEATITKSNYINTASKQASITVQYEVDGKKYTAIEKKQIDNLPRVGNKIIIKYNSKNPSEVIFDRSANYVFMIFGIIFTVCGLLVLYKSILLKGKSNTLKYDMTDINKVDNPKQ